MTGEAGEFTERGWIHDKTKSYPSEDIEYKQSSSLSRYHVVGEALQNFQEKSVTPDHFIEMLASHQNRPYSPCRHPEGDIHGLTLATAFFDFEVGIMRLYRGNPCLAGNIMCCPGFDMGHKFCGITPPLALREY